MIIASANVKKDIEPAITTSLLTRESVNDLKLKVGDCVKEMLKPTSVMTVIT
jgi:molybdopterin-binding protein